MLPQRETQVIRTISEDNGRKCVSCKTSVGGHRRANRIADSDKQLDQDAGKGRGPERWACCLKPLFAKEHSLIPEKTAGSQANITSDSLRGQRDQRQRGFLENPPHFALAAGWTLGERGTEKTRPCGDWLRLGFKYFNFETGLRSRSACNFCLKFQD